MSPKVCHKITSKNGGKNSCQPTVPTVDGETRNPGNSPVEVGSWQSHYLMSFDIFLKWLFGISEPSTLPPCLLRKNTSTRRVHHLHQPPVHQDPPAPVFLWCEFAGAFGW